MLGQQEKNQWYTLSSGFPEHLRKQLRTRGLGIFLGKTDCWVSSADKDLGPGQVVPWALSLQ